MYILVHKVNKNHIKIEIEKVALTKFLPKSRGEKFIKLPLQGSATAKLSGKQLNNTVVGVLVS